MRLTKSKKRSQSWNENSLIPMINVVFLLLVFFMIAGTIQSLPPLPLNLPESALVNTPQSVHTLYLAADGSLAIDQERVSADDLEGALRSLMTGAADVQLSAVGAQSAGLLAVQADAAVTIAQLKSVIDKLRDAGVVELELLTTLAPTVTIGR